MAGSSCIHSGLLTALPRRLLASPRIRPCMPLHATPSPTACPAPPCATRPPQVLDVVASVSPEYWELKEAALFLSTPGALPADAALGLYVRAGASEWLYCGCVHAGHPSEAMPLQVRGGGCVDERVGALAVHTQCAHAALAVPPRAHAGPAALSPPALPP